MARELGNIEFPTNLEVLKKAPLDARTRVETVSDLTSIPYAYKQMVVAVYNDDSNPNGLYILQGDDSTNSTHWLPLSAQGPTGDDGKSSTSGYVFYSSASDNAPTFSTVGVDTTYNFSTGIFTALPNGWSQTPPTATPGSQSKNYWHVPYSVIETVAGADPIVGTPTFGTVAKQISFAGLVTFSGENDDEITNINGVSLNITAIDGSKITTGEIKSHGYADGSDAIYSDTGTKIILSGNDAGTIKSENFSIDGSGNAHFKGDLSGSNITGATGTFTGTLSVGSEEYSISEVLNTNVNTVSATSLGLENFVNITPASIQAGTTAANVGLGNVQNIDTASIQAGTTAANVGLGDYVGTNPQGILDSALTASKELSSTLANFPLNSAIPTIATPNNALAYVFNTSREGTAQIKLDIRDAEATGTFPNYIGIQASCNGLKFKTRLSGLDIFEDAIDRINDNGGTALPARTDNAYSLPTTSYTEDVYVYSGSNTIRVWSSNTDGGTLKNIEVLYTQNKDRTSGTLAGWQIGTYNINSGPLENPNKNIYGYNGASGGMILNYQGSLHSPNFYINKDGSAGFKGTVTIDGTDLNSSNTFNPSTYSFGPNGFQLGSVPSPTAGLHLGSDKLGYHDGNKWSTYMDSSGNFHLSGSGGSGLSWSNGVLVINGEVHVTNTGDFTSRDDFENEQSSSVDTFLAAFASASAAQSAAEDFATSASNGARAAAENTAADALGSATGSLEDSIGDVATTASLSASAAQTAAENFATTASNNAQSAAENTAADALGSATGSLETTIGNVATTASLSASAAQTAAENFATSASNDAQTAAEATAASQLGSATGSLENSIGNVATSASNAIETANSSSLASSEASSSAAAAQTSADNALDYATEAITSASTAQNRIDDLILVTASFSNPETYNFGPGMDMTLGSLPTVPQTPGLYYSADALGFHNGSNFLTFMSSSGLFVLSGSGDDGLVWNGQSLQIGNPGVGPSFEYNFSGSLDSNLFNSSITTTVSYDSPVFGNEFNNNANGWDEGFRTKATFDRKDGGVFEWDIVVSNSPSATRIGLFASSSSPSVIPYNQKHTVYFQSNDIFIIENGNSGNQVRIVEDAWVTNVPALFRVSIQLKPTGAVYKIFKNGDFSVPYAIYDSQDQNVSTRYLNPGASIYYSGSDRNVLFSKMSGGKTLGISSKISGNTIQTGTIISNNHSGTSDGSAMSTAGMAIDLDNGAISSQNFRIASNGDSEFSGTMKIGNTALNEDNTLNENVDTPVLLHITTTGTGTSIPHGLSTTESTGLIYTFQSKVAGPAQLKLVVYDAEAKDTSTYPNYQGTQASVNGNPLKTRLRRHDVGGADGTNNTYFDTVQIVSGSNSLNLWSNTSDEARLIEAEIVYIQTDDKKSGTIGGWTVDPTAIYSGTKDTNGYKSDGGVTLAAAGSIHSKDFYIDTSGNAKFKGELEIEGVGPSLDYNFSGSLDSNLFENNISTQRSHESPTYGNSFNNAYVESNWGQGFRTKAIYDRENGGTFEWDVVASSSPTTMLGLYDKDESSYSFSKMTHAFYFVGTSFYIYEKGVQLYRVNGSSNPITDATALMNSVRVNGTPTLFRVSIQVKPAGAIYRVFKDGDFSEPFWTYDSTNPNAAPFADTNKSPRTDRYLKPGAAIHKNGNSDYLIFNRMSAGKSLGQSTKISGNTIKTGKILSNNHSGTSDGSSMSTAGMAIDLDNGSISSQNFRINEQGSAFFAGTVSGSRIIGGSLEGGSLSIPENVGDGTPNFSVDSEGNMTAVNAIISGSINADTGKIGNWEVNNGSLRDTTTRITLDPSQKGIILRDTDGELKAKMTADTSLSPPGASKQFYDSDQYIISSNFDLTGYTNSNRSFKTQTKSSDTSNGQQFPKTGFYTVDRTRLGQIENYSTALKEQIRDDIPTGESTSPSSYSQVASYLSTLQPDTAFSPSEDSYRGEAELETVIEMHKQGVVAQRETINSVVIKGRKELDYWSLIKSGANAGDWERLTTYSAASIGAESKRNLITDPLIFEVNNTSAYYSFRVVLNLKVRSSREITHSLTSNNQPTFSTATQTTRITTSGTYTPIQFSNIDLLLPSNFSEISGGGVQVVTNNNQYVQIPRNEPGAAATTKILETKGGITTLDNTTGVALSATGSINIKGNIDATDRSIHFKYLNSYVGSSIRKYPLPYIHRGSYSTTLPQNSNDSIHTVSFSNPSNVGDADYYVLGNLRGGSASSWNNQNDCIATVFDKTTTSFKLAIREMSNTSGTMIFEYVLAYPY